MKSEKVTFCEVLGIPWFYHASLFHNVITSMHIICSTPSRGKVLEIYVQYFTSKVNVMDA